MGTEGREHRQRSSEATTPKRGPPGTFHPGEGWQKLLPDTFALALLPRYASAATFKARRRWTPKWHSHLGCDSPRPHDSHRSEAACVTSLAPDPQASSFVPLAAYGPVLDPGTTGWIHARSTSPGTDGSFITLVDVIFART